MKTEIEYQNANDKFQHKARGFLYCIDNAYRNKNTAKNPEDNDRMFSENIEKLKFLIDKLSK